jgi:uncharacterized phiE125 gp8 family phage protein
MTYVIKTQPVTEPVTLAEMRSHLGITQLTDTARDVIITGRITSARVWCEHYTRSSYITQTMVSYTVDFPYNVLTNHRINLKAPLQSVTSVTYLDSTGTRQTLSPSLYLIDLVNACIEPAFGTVWPNARTQLNSVQVEYVSGYGNAASVPEPIKDAIRFIVGQWETFQTSMEGISRVFTIPNAAKQLLDNYIDMREYF